jgi:glycerol-3-phosphate acyltransferase PlsY
MMMVSLIFFAYFLGSLSSAIIICRLLNLPDPRTEGSGNPGATNVLRIANKKTAALVFFLDALKGLLPIGLGHFIFHIQAPWLAVIGLAALIGHIYPIYFRFQGGKGVATFFGVLIGLSPMLTLIAALIWFGVAKIFRYSSLAAMITMLVTPLFAYFFTPNNTAIISLMCLLILWRHRLNVLRLLMGVEGKF